MKKIINGIDIDSLLRARDVFEEFRIDMHTDRDKAGAIQSFEFCYDLAWKTMKRILETRGVIVNSPREAFRAAALNKLIDDPEIWFLFINDKNLTIAPYDNVALGAAVERLPVFSKQLTIFISRLETL